MAVQNPNQYQCNNMEPGDIIYVKKRSLLYKIIRYLFYKDKPKLSVTKNWNKPNDKAEYYQEDCTLMYSFELQCVQTIENEIPCIVAYGKTNKVITAFNIHKLEVSLYNLQITFKNKLSIIIPLDRIKSALTKNEIKLKSIDTKKAMMENLKFIRYKGDYFKKYVIDNDIHTWVPQYCMLCGEPVTFTFKEDVIEINGSCNCGNLSFNINKMSYDEFAIWYAGQTDKLIKAYYDKFWFKKE